jgi:deoxyribodipyrimidine photo-lyase
VLWFRRDLRLADHPALVEAAEIGDVVPLFVVDPLLTARSGEPRLAFLAASLRALDESMDGALVLRHGDPVRVVAALAAEVGAHQVLATADDGPYGRRRDAAVAEALAADGRTLRLVGSNYAVAPGTLAPAALKAGERRGFAVFTPFRRAWEAHGWAAPVPVPDVSWRGAPDVPCDGHPVAPEITATLPAAGEAAAHARLEAFLADGVDAYRERRDRPALEDGTSRLSPHLHFGSLHPRQALAHLGDAEGPATFRSELAWREFYADVLHHRPASARQNLQRRMDAMVLDTDGAARARFDRWAAGRTGYPIVDAGMRQLLATGWMHNRVRMITASFLVKDLHLAWQWGARHFLDHLIDGDLASNNHGWQWAAGTGTDAAPYFRVFNPTSQSQRFDPDGDYIRTWVPELAGLSTTAIHQPGASPPADYPAPIVDHAAERVEALSRHKAAMARARDRPAGAGSR